MSGPSGKVKRKGRRVLLGKVRMSWAWHSARFVLTYCILCFGFIARCTLWFCRIVDVCRHSVRCIFFLFIVRCCYSRKFSLSPTHCKVRIVVWYVVSLYDKWRWDKCERQVWHSPLPPSLLRQTSVSDRPSIGQVWLALVFSSRMTIITIVGQVDFGNEAMTSISIIFLNPSYKLSSEARIIMQWPTISMIMIITFSW